MKAQSVYDAILRHQQQYYVASNDENYQEVLINPFAFNELTVKGIIDLYGRKSKSKTAYFKWSY